MSRDTIPDRVQRFGETLKANPAMHFRVGGRARSVGQTMRAQSTLCGRAHRQWV